MVIKRTESHKNEEQFHFSTKAETLASLKGVLVSGKLCDQAVIPVQDWLNDQQKVANEIVKLFSRFSLGNSFKLSSRRY